MGQNMRKVSFYIITFAVSLAVIIFLYNLILGQKNNNFPSEAKFNIDQSSGELFVGKENAQVTIIEYFSMTCHHCSKFHNEVLPKIEEEFVRKGLVKFIFRDFPLDPLAFEAAKIPHCYKNDFRKVQNMLLHDQKKWIANALSMDEYVSKGMSNMKTLLANNGLDYADIESCIENDELGNMILETRLNAQSKMKINSTPTFVINGEIYSGALPYSQIEKIIKENL